MTLPASVSPYWGSQLLPSGKARWLVYTLKIVMDHQEHDTSQVAQWQRICLPMQEMQETWVQFLSQEDLLEEEMATCSSILAWEIPWTEEPGGLQSMGSKRVGHDSVPKHRHTHK